MPVLGVMSTPCKFKFVLVKFESWDSKLDGNKRSDSYLKGSGTDPKELQLYRLWGTRHCDLKDAKIDLMTLHAAIKLGIPSSRTYN